MRYGVWRTAKDYFSGAGPRLENDSLDSLVRRAVEAIPKKGRSHMIWPARTTPSRRDGSTSARSPAAAIGSATARRAPFSSFAKTRRFATAFDSGREHLGASAEGSC